MPGRTKGRPRTDLVAIVDLGSAAVRFIIARIRPSARYDVVVEERVPTRLGGGLAIVRGHPQPPVPCPGVTLRLATSTRIC